jgi:hypothetical protein
VNDVTTFDHGDVLGWQPIHQDRPIGIVEGRALCRGEQLHWHRTSLHERLEVPPLGSQESGDAFDIELQPILNRVLRVPSRPHRVLLKQRQDGPRRILLSDPYGILHARSGVAELQGPGKTRRIFDHYPITEVLLKADKSQGHNRAERMTSQDIHRARCLGEDVLRHVLNRQVRRTSSVPRPMAQQVRYLHPPPEVMQILLEPPPGQLAGQHSVEQQDRPVIRHTVIQLPFTCT